MNTATHLFNKVVLMATDNTRPDPESGIHDVPVWLAIAIGGAIIGICTLITIITYLVKWYKQRDREDEMGFSDKFGGDREDNMYIK